MLEVDAAAGDLDLVERSGLSRFGRRSGLLRMGAAQKEEDRGTDCRLVELDRHVLYIRMK
ncbi:hypothetical protein [Paucibacter sp. M5-1]|uniref:hypothetical protein n=1 Tax=Paucibacter sp. M5-1 TaxID=3015998 RepID=UPI0022B86968|nr:hypothetical protein [Paucibacter sp. M5-1]MCZ7883111.1 hypothetical protein [Paucibacter sp. M5-1]